MDLTRPACILLVASACYGDEYDPIERAVPPPRDANAERANGPSSPWDYFAITGFTLGQTSSSWTVLGYERDSLNLSDQGEPCRPRDGLVIEDGDGGIDNMFGKAVLPLLGSELERTLNAALDEGVAGMIVGRVASSGLVNETGIDAFVYEARRIDGKLHVTSESLRHPELQPSPFALRTGRWHFSNSYISEGEWVSDDVDVEGRVVPFRIPLGTAWLRLELRRPLITMPVVDWNAPEEPLQGTISGVILVDELIAELERTSDGQDLELQIEALRSSADILSSGEHDPSQDCDAISFGAGFDALPLEVVINVAEP